MTPALQTNWITVYQGHAIEVLAALPPGSVHAICTSPPYWGLRSYDIPPVVWDDPGNCPGHEWMSERYYTQNSASTRSAEAFSEPGPANAQRLKEGRWRNEVWCCHCGAWKGSLGLEPTPQLFIAHLMQVMDALWRVLRDDGVAFINLGDTYSGGGGYFPNAPSNRNGSKQSTNHGSIVGRTKTGIREKSLCLIPDRFALAAQERGWIVRQKFPWPKRSAMPSSQTDRPTSALDWWFMLTKEPDYYSDMEAVRKNYSEKGLNDAKHAYGYTANSKSYDAISHGIRGSGGLNDPTITRDKFYQHGGRTYRNTDLWFQSLREPWGLVGVGDELIGLDVVSQGTKQAHYATFGDKLVTPLLQMATSEKGACSQCGSPWKRVLEHRETGQTQQTGRSWDTGAGSHGTYHRNGREAHPKTNPVYAHVTTGWAPTCTCGGFLVRGVPHRRRRTTRWHWQQWQARLEAKWPPLTRCVVLDPFAGTGTTLRAARNLFHQSIGIELSPAYIRFMDAWAHVEPLPLGLRPPPTPVGAKPATEQQQTSLFPAEIA